ncbi:aspartate aminotransferase family protein [Geminicoccaceae bacterium 1502E]|nr:aspartate aminotransferase family protein [Geminicoccaceae bacterium 1502E]
MMQNPDSAVFYRNLANRPPTILRGEGVWLHDSDGRRYLDAVGGAAVVAIGHGVAEITEDLARQAAEIPYVYGASFTHRWQEELASRLIGKAPPNMRAAYIVSGGSEANETAIKMARQYFLHEGQPQRHKILSRRQGYHGITIATLSISGRTSWRQPFDPYLIHSRHVAPPYCYRCPFGKEPAGCGMACADDLETAILLEGPETVAAFFMEPVSGTSLAANVPPEGYLERVREICDRYGVLLVADEVLCGYGRTGAPFAIMHSGVEADLLTCGKAVGSGYTPLAAVLASDRVVDAFRRGGGEFTHGFTYSGHPLSCHVGVKVFDYMERHDLWERAAATGDLLHARLADLAGRHACIGEVRGRGMLAGIEFVADRASKRPFPTSVRFAERVVAAARRRGVLLLAGTPGVNHGRDGDQIQISPPYVMSEAELDLLVETLDAAIGEAVEEVIPALTR